MTHSPRSPTPTATAPTSSSAPTAPDQPKPSSPTYETVLNLISATTTRTGLTATARLDTGSYPTGIEISEQHAAALTIHPDDFHGEWNHTIPPQRLRPDLRRATFTQAPSGSVGGIRRAASLDPRDRFLSSIGHSTTRPVIRWISAFLPTFQEQL
ncbi:hypothetical protein [Streptomyces sp. NPDC048106]|uniref:ISAzo13-like element transposase-related protein n=1 Tax=Streptomyces sp. NPDC048106 TaxID=3155750 RepID=UPI003454E7D7